MFDNVIAVPLHFTVEFVGFLVTAGAAILCLTRRTLVPGDPSNRVTAAIGFGILAAAHVAHGGGFHAEVEADGSQILVAARAVGLAFVMIGVAGGLRAGAAALAPFRFEEPLVIAPAVAAVILSVTAFGGSLARGPKALRRLAAASVLLAVSEILTGASHDAKFGSEVVPGYAYAAHGFKLVAYLFMAAWVWRAVRSSIRTRFVASFAGLLVAVVLALATTLTGVLSNNVEQEKLATLARQLKDVVEELESQEVGDLKNDLDSVADINDIRDAVAAGGNLNGIADGIMLFPFGFDFVMLTDERGKVLGFSQRDDARLNDLDRIGIAGTQVIAEAVRDETASASPVSVQDRFVTLLAARPVTGREPGQGMVGLVAAGRLVNDLYVSEVSARLDAKATILVGNRVVATKLPKSARHARLIPRQTLLQVRTSDEPVANRHALGNDIYFSAIETVRSPGGDPVATMMLSSQARTIGATRQQLTRILFIVAMAVGAIALVLAYLSGRRITRPIQVLTDAAVSVREGDLSVQAPVAGDDEVGRLGETFNDMTASLLNLTNDLRAAAREEHQLRARIETIIQSMADGLVATDAEHRVVAFNREAEVITGLKARHAVGRSIDDVLDIRDPQDESVRAPIQDLSPGSLDNVFIARKGGERIPVAVISAVLTGEEGEVAGGVAVLRDMTREREVERMKTEFLSNISHELRTPLTPIKGYAEILTRKDIPTDKAKKFAAGILESTGRLERIVELLVDFSAMEAGRLSPRTQPVDIAELIDDLVTRWRDRAPQHGFEVDVEGKLPRVAGDERLLRRSLHEVIDNAVKFSPDGGVIRLAARGAGSGDGERRHRAVDITISDEGIGIPPEDIPNIFSDFHQLDGSETRTYGGLGLGLAFVKRIVEAHDGRIGVISQPRGGTEFTITLPAAKRSQQKAPRPKKEAPGRSQDLEATQAVPMVGEDGAPDDDREAATGA